MIPAEIFRSTRNPVSCRISMMPLNTLKPLFLSLTCVVAFLFANFCAAQDNPADDAADDADAPVEETVVEQSFERLPELPFKPGEKLSYEIGWGFFHVASATMQITGPEDFKGRKAWKIEMFVRTNGFADTIMKVRDHNLAWVDEDFTHPLRYIKEQNEGSVHHDVVVDFDWDAMEVRYTDKGKTRDPVKIVPGTWDMLSITYAVRSMALDGMSLLRLPSTDGKKLAYTDVTINPPKRIKTPMGSFDAILLRPDTKNLGGIFRKSKNAGIDLWFSNDERHLPVRVSSKVIVGSFAAELIAVEIPEDDVDAAGKDAASPEKEKPAGAETAASEPPSATGSEATASATDAVGN